MASYKSLLFSNTLSDFTVVTGDGHKIPAHGTMLYARSTFFQGLLSSDMKEKHERQVVLEENLETVRSMLQFIYTDTYDGRGNVTLTHDARMYIIGDKYGIEGLQETASDKFAHRARPLAKKPCEVLLIKDFFAAVSMIYTSSLTQDDDIREVMVDAGTNRLALARRNMQSSFTFTRATPGQRSAAQELEDDAWNQGMSDIPQYVNDVLLGVNLKMGLLEHGLLKLARVKCTTEACEHTGTSSGLMWHAIDKAKCGTCGAEVDIRISAVKDLYSYGQDLLWLRRFSA